MKKVVSILLVLIMVFSLAACGSSSTSSSSQASSSSAQAGSSSAGKEEQEVIRIRFGHENNETNPMGMAATRFKELIEERSNGRVQVDIYPNGQLSNQNINVTFQLTQSGDIDMSQINAPAVPVWQLLWLPYLFPDAETAYDVLNGEAGKALLGTMDDIGLKGLGYLYQGFRQFTSSKAPIVVPEDAKGKNLRVVESETMTTFIEALGAHPTVTTMGELYVALQQRTVDGQENPISTIYSKKLYEAQDYLSLTEHIFGTFIWCCNKDFYEGLPEDVRQLLDECVEDALEYQWSIAEDIEKQNLEEMKASGIEIIELTPEQKEQWKEATAIVHEKMEKTIGADMLAKFYQALGREKTW